MGGGALTVSYRAPSVARAVPRRLVLLPVLEGSQVIPTLTAYQAFEHEMKGKTR